MKKEVWTRHSTCPFRKHRDKDWVDVIEEDRPYVEWLVSADGPDMGTELYDHVMGLLEDGDG